MGGNGEGEEREGGRMGRRASGQEGKWTGGRMDRKTNGLRDEWTGGRMDRGRMDRRMSIPPPVHSSSSPFVLHIVGVEDDEAVRLL